METSGAADDVVKLLPALTIDPDELDEGLEILTAAAATVLGAPRRPRRRTPA